MTAAVVALGIAGLTACDSASGENGPKLAAMPRCPTRSPAAPCCTSATRPPDRHRGGRPRRGARGRGRRHRVGQHQRWPKNLERVPADAINVGSAQDIPSLSRVDGTNITIVATTSRVDAINHPVYELGVAPGVDVTSLEDLKGKKIAYSPGQAQGALVLRRSSRRAQPGRRRARRDPERRQRLLTCSAARRSTSRRSAARCSRHTSPSTATTAARRSRPGTATTRACSTRRWGPPRTPARRPRSAKSSWSGPRPSSGSTSTPRSTPRRSTSTTRG